MDIIISDKLSDNNGPIQLYSTEFGTDGGEVSFDLEDRGPVTGENVPSADFVSLVTAVSVAYSRGQYLKFSEVDGNAGERQLVPLGNGSVFSAYRQDIKYSLPSFSGLGKYETRTSKVVVKRTIPLFGPTGCSKRQQELQSLIKEVQILSHKPLYWHPNVITLLGLTWRCEQFFPKTAVQPQLVLEAADQTLHDLLSSSEELPFQTKLHLSLDVVNGLTAIHACGIVHGDIKTVNILVQLIPSQTDRSSNRYIGKIADFSHSWVDTGKATRFRGGTSGFMAPEVYRGDLIRNGKAIDIYSVGVVLWRIMVENNPLPVNPEDTSVSRNQKDLCLAAALEHVVTWLENDANEPKHRLIRQILVGTLSENPETRSLQLVQSEILRFLRVGFPTLDLEDIWDAEYLARSRPMKEYHDIPTLTQIFINYQAFVHAAGPVQDQLVACLEQISQSPNDPRRPRAFYELGICNVAQFGNPNEMSPGRSLDYFFQAAKLGDVTAKGYFKRLLDTLSAEGHIPTERRRLMEEHVSEWLLEAAVAGHQAAFEDYTNNAGPEKKRALRDLLASERFDFEFSSNLEDFKEEVANASEEEMTGNFPMNEHMDTVLHWAAYKNLDDHLRYLLDELLLDINCRNSYGNTPLMTACSVGNLKAALLLLARGSDVNAINPSGETCLHHVWRFTDEEAKHLLRVLVDHGIDFEIEVPLQRANPDGNIVNRVAVETDPLPTLHGKAIERVAARGRTALVDEFLALGPAIEPRNGSLIRRMILWASLLNFEDTRQLLVEYGQGVPTNKSWRKAAAHPYLSAIESSVWEHEGFNKVYMDAVAQGWVSRRGEGWPTPEAFWRMCCHGPSWRRKLQGTIQAVAAGSNMPLCCFEPTLLRALNARRPLFCQTYLEMYINQHGEFNTYQDTRRNHACTTHRDPQERLSGFDIDKTENKEESIQTRLIDKVLFNNDQTLLQRSIIAGDRRIFGVLVRFQASVIRPWSECRSKTSESATEDAIWEKQMTYLNCYTVLALHSKDVWFAHEFHKFGVSHEHLSPHKRPWLWLRRQRSEFARGGKSFDDGPEYWPPLLHALHQGFYYLAAFLLAQGARLEERVNMSVNVCDRALSSFSLTQDTARFLFARQGQYTMPDGTLAFISQSLLPPRLFDAGKGYFVLLLLADKWAQPVCYYRHSFLSVIPFHYSALNRSISGYCRALFKAVKFAFMGLTVKIFGPLFFIHLLILSSCDEFLHGQFRNAMEREDMEEDSHHDDLHAWIFPLIWDCILNQFPGTSATAQWHRDGFFISRSHSLLWTVLASKSLSKLPTSHKEKIAMRTIKHYERTLIRHKPGLLDLFVWNEYHFVTTDSPVANRLHSLGFRHPLSHFAEAKLLGALVILAPSILAFLSGVYENISTTALQSSTLPSEYWFVLRFYCGVPILTCLLFSFFTQVYVLESLIVLSLGAGTIYCMFFLETPIALVTSLLGIMFGGLGLFVFLASVVRFGVHYRDGRALLGVLFHRYPYTGYMPRQYLQGFRRALGSVLRIPRQNLSNPDSRTSV